MCSGPHKRATLTTGGKRDRQKPNRKPRFFLQNLPVPKPTDSKIFETVTTLLTLSWVSTKPEIEIYFRDVQNPILAVSRLWWTYFPTEECQFLAVSGLHLIDPSSIEHNSACWMWNGQPQNIVHKTCQVHVETFWFNNNHQVICQWLSCSLSTQYFR